MRHRWLVCPVLAALLLAGCAGCRLAKPEAAEAPEPDRLVGVYVTEEYLDLFDMEGYLADNAGRLAGGDTVVDARDSEKYGGRVWAVRQDDGDWVFEDLDGFGYYAYRYENEAVEEGMASHLDEGLDGGGMHLTTTDAGERIELEATIYHVPDGTVGYYFNPVYQTAAGEVYLTAGSGITLGGSTEGEACAHTVSDETTVTVDGKSAAVGCTATVHVQIMSAPEAVTLLQMDGDDRVLDRKTYAPGQVPESLAPDPDCAYLIVATRGTGGTVTRELADTGAPWLSTFRVRDDGVCVRQDTALLWEEADA